LTQPTNATDFLGKIVEAKIDRPLGSKHPQYSFTYPVNYGFIPNTSSPDGEELDAYILFHFLPLPSNVIQTSSVALSLGTA
jgi:inorganic pyrophosphatase